MRKFLQWCLVATIAIALLLGVAYQLLSSITAHKKDESVAAFKEQLRQSEAKAAVPADTSSAQIKVQAVPTPAPLPSADYVSLRERWLALFGKLDSAMAACGSSQDLYAAAIRAVYRPEDGGLTEEERNLLTAYLDCMGDTVEELLMLCQEDARPADLEDALFHYTSSVVSWGFIYAITLLRIHLMKTYLDGNHASAVDAMCALINLSETRLSHPSGWQKYPGWMWRIVNAGLASQTVEDASWNRLLKELEELRSCEKYGDRVRTASSLILETYENWSYQLTDIPRSKYPVTYAQNWAYRYVTTPLFNHDLDRYSRAMQLLVELSSLPYYEAMPELEQFYVDFDVEPSMDEMRFMRGNSAWKFVLGLSREGLKDHAAYQAHIDVVRIAILLDQYHRTTNTYPDALDALADKLGGEVPINPLNGTPYFYTPFGEIYGLGFRYSRDEEVVGSEENQPDKIRYWDARSLQNR